MNRKYICLRRRLYYGLAEHDYVVYYDSKYLRCDKLFAYKILLDNLAIGYHMRTLLGELQKSYK